MSTNDGPEIEIEKGDLDGVTHVWLVDETTTTKEMVLLGKHKSPMMACILALATLDSLRADMADEIKRRGKQLAAGLA